MKTGCSFVVPARIWEQRHVTDKSMYFSLFFRKVPFKRRNFPCSSHLFPKLRISLVSLKYMITCSCFPKPLGGPQQIRHPFFQKDHSVLLLTRLKTNSEMLKDDGISYFFSIWFGSTGHKSWTKIFLYTFATESWRFSFEWRCFSIWRLTVKNSNSNSPNISLSSFRFYFISMARSSVTLTRHENGAFEHTLQIGGI